MRDERADDGGNKARSPGRVRISRKTIARGMPVAPAEPVVTAACLLCCRRAMGAACIRHSPRPLFFEGHCVRQDSGASRAAGMSRVVLDKRAKRARSRTHYPRIELLRTLERRAHYTTSACGNGSWLSPGRQRRAPRMPLNLPRPSPLSSPHSRTLPRHWWSGHASDRGRCRCRFPSSCLPRERADRPPNHPEPDFGAPK